MILHGDRNPAFWLIPSIPRSALHGVGDDEYICQGLLSCRLYAYFIFYKVILQGEAYILTVEGSMLMVLHMLLLLLE